MSGIMTQNEPTERLVRRAKSGDRSAFDLRLVAPHYRRTEDEGRTLVQSALADAADLEVTERELRVRLVPLSSAHRTRAIAAICDDLNGTRTAFPGSRLFLHYSIRGA